MQRAGLRPVLCAPPRMGALRPSTPGVFAGLVVPAPTFLGAPPQAPGDFRFTTKVTKGVSGGAP